MAGQAYKFDEIFAPDVKAGLKELAELSKQVNNSLKNVKVAPKSGKGLENLNKELKITTGYTKSLTALNKQRIATEKKADALRKKEIAEQNKLNLEYQKKLALKRQLETEIKKEAREYAKLKKAEADILRLQKKEILSLRELAQLTNALTLKRSKLTLKTKKGREEYNKLTVVIARNNRELLKQDKSIGRLQRNVGNYKSAISGLAGAFGLMGGAMLAVSVLRNMGDIVDGFSSGVSKLGAISGATASELALLSTQAKSLGAETAHSANDIIRLDTELAKLGFTAKEIENAVPGIQSFATATGTDLATASELAGSALNIFGLDAKEAQRVSDVLSLSTSSSALSVQKLSDALPYVGTSAKTAGKDIEWTTARLGILVDRGLKATTAGTSLRKIFGELSKKGISYKEALNQINTASDKSKKAIELFGLKAKDSAIILAENIDQANELEKSFRNAGGSAEKMSKQMLDNVGGDLILLKSAWEGMVLSIEDGNGAFSKLARGGIQLLISSLKEIGVMQKDLSEIIDDLKTINKALADLTPHVSFLNDEFKDEAVSLFKDKLWELVNPLGGILKAIKNVIKGFKNMLVWAGLAESDSEQRTKKIVQLLKEKNEVIKTLSKEEREIYRNSAEELKQKLDSDLISLEQYQIAMIDLINSIEHKKKSIKTISPTSPTGKPTSGKRIPINSTPISAPTIDFTKINDVIDNELIYINTKIAKKKDDRGFFAKLFNVKSDEDADLIKQQGEKILNFAINLAQRQLDEEIRINNERLSLIDRRINKSQEELQTEISKYNELKEKGSAYSSERKRQLFQQLQNEKELKKKALLEEEKLKKKQKRMDIITANINIASSILQAFGSYPPPYSFIIAAITAGLGAIQLANIKNAHYAEGTNYVALNGNRKGRDTIPAMLDEGERVIPTRDNSKIPLNFPNSDIPLAIDYYRKKGNSSIIVVDNNADVLNEIAKNTASNEIFYKGKLIQERKGIALINYM